MIFVILAVYIHIFLSLRYTKSLPVFSSVDYLIYVSIEFTGAKLLQQTCMMQGVHIYKVRHILYKVKIKSRQD